jgi:hypothetical protein
MNDTPALKQPARVDAKGIGSTALLGSVFAARGTPAELCISRTSSPEVIRIRVEIDRQVLDIEVELADFALALTGRGATPAKVLRHFMRPSA